MPLHKRFAGLTADDVAGAQACASTPNVTQVTFFARMDSLKKETEKQKRIIKTYTLKVYIRTKTNNLLFCPDGGLP